MSEQFAQLIEDLSKVLEVPLKPEANDSCMILVDEKYKVQIEANKKAENIIVAGYLGNISPGKYRIDVLSAALKANALPYPQLGVFGFNPYKNQLAIFQLLTFESLTGDKLAEFLNGFIKKTAQWHDAIEEGKTHPS